MNDSVKSGAIDSESVEAKIGTTYPPQFDAGCAGREKRRLGDAVGLTQFGVNLVRMPPGVASAQRHWHTHEDEFIYVLEGELVLVTDAGEQVLGPGMIAGFPAGVADGHRLVNRSGADALYMEVGTRDARDDVDYPDIDMLRRRDAAGKPRFVHKDGAPYDE